jgi:c-di-GMP-binding flagellar brake protein YcgR
MATPAGRIEKELLLKVMFEEKLPVMYVNNGTEYTFALERPAKEELVFSSDKPPSRLKASSKLSLRFDYREQTVNFSTEVLSQQGDLIFCKTPERLYKNQDRAYLRVDAPSDLKIGFTFRGEHYNPELSKISNISASGLLFAYPLGNDLLSTLPVDAELTVIIKAPNRTMNLAAKVVRRSKDRAAGYIGCRFVNMAPEDMRFLFERLYGKLFDGSAFFSEQD